MHRSGTSFAANIIFHLGVPLNTSSLIPTDSWNPIGYYENLELVVLNDRLLLGNCPGLLKFRQIPSGSRPLWLIAWMTLFKLRYLLRYSNSSINKRANLLQNEITNFAVQYQDLLLKDPRFSLTLQVWRNYTAIDSILYTYRHPLEVAKSLRKRDKIPLWLGLRQWAFHIETFLQQKGDLPVTYINFNNFFEKDLAIKEIKRCYDFTGLPYSDIKTERLLGKCLRKDLKIQHATKSSIPPRYYELFEKLETLHSSV